MKFCRASSRCDAIASPAVRLSSVLPPPAFEMIGRRRRREKEKQNSLSLSLSDDAARIPPAPEFVSSPAKLLFVPGWRITHNTLLSASQSVAVSVASLPPAHRVRFRRSSAASLPFSPLSPRRPTYPGLACCRRRSSETKKEGIMRGWAAAYLVFFAARSLMPAKCLPPTRWPICQNGFEFDKCPFDCQVCLSLRLLIYGCGCVFV